MVCKKYCEQEPGGHKWNTMYIENHTLFVCENIDKLLMNSSNFSMNISWSGFIISDAEQRGFFTILFTNIYKENISFVFYSKEPTVLYNWCKISRILPTLLSVFSINLNPVGVS
jgi:hypothetical protein